MKSPAPDTKATMPRWKGPKSKTFSKKKMVNDASGKTPKPSRKPPA